MKKAYYYGYLFLLNLYWLIGLAVSGASDHASLENIYTQRVLWEACFCMLDTLFVILYMRFGKLLLRISALILQVVVISRTIYYCEVLMSEFNWFLCWIDLLMLSFVFCWCVVTLAILRNKRKLS